MISVSDKHNCCGCGACAQTCPKDCIVMTPDSEGFLYPQVDADSCVQCGACLKACPMGGVHPDDPQSVEAYAAQNGEETLRLASSSGGIFTSLAQWVLSSHGVVFGAAFDEDFSVKHRMVQTQAELELLRGSKYVQSQTGHTFREVKVQLESGRMVLYTGVACQIAGLRKYLKKDYEGLYTVDVLCHGVPSPGLWRSYLRYQENTQGEAVQSVNFRGKTFGWKNFSMEQVFESGKTYCVAHDDDPYVTLFLENICLRPSCHSCPFKVFPRDSDLTLGDAWGISDTMPEMDDDKGTSLIIVNSEKGAQLLSQIQSRLNCKQGQLDALLPPDADSRHPVAPHPRREAFFDAYAKGADIPKLMQILKGTLLRRAVGRLLRKLRER